MLFVLLEWSCGKLQLLTVESFSMSSSEAPRDARPMFCRRRRFFFFLKHASEKPAESQCAEGDVTHLRELGKSAVSQHGDVAQQLVDTVPKEKVKSRHSQHFSIKKWIKKAVHKCWMARKMRERISVEILEFHFWPRVKPEHCTGTKHNHYFYTTCFVLQASYHFLLLSNVCLL